MAKIHFLNVGHGDCTIIEHNNGNLTVIDINNGSDDMDDVSVEEIVKEAGHNGLSSAYDVLLWKQGVISENQLLKRAGYKIELTNPIEFLAKEYPKQPVFRYIQTHPDFDHLRGLATLRDSENKIQNFWDTANTKAWDGTHSRQVSA